MLIKISTRKCFILNSFLFYAAFILFNLYFFNVFNYTSLKTATHGDGGDDDVHVSIGFDEEVYLKKGNFNQFDYREFIIDFFVDLKSEQTSKYDRLVIFLIDALRVDFIFERNDLMPRVKELIDGDNAWSFILNVKSPTVTLPRLKV